MRIWQISCDVNNYSCLSPSFEYTAADIFQYDGRPHSKNWVPHNIKRITSEDVVHFADIHRYTFFPVVSERVVEALKPLISNDVEFLPVNYDGYLYYGINVITVIDAIDYKKSEYIKYTFSNKIMLFNKYAFRKKVVKNYNIFKIIDEKRRYAFVSDQFKEVIERNGFKGLKFKLVWDSEEN